MYGQSILSNDTQSLVQKQSTTESEEFLFEDDLFQDFPDAFTQEASTILPCVKSSHKKHHRPVSTNLFNKDYCYGVIDHVLQGTKSEIGLKWSMLDCSQEQLKPYTNTQIEELSVLSPLSSAGIESVDSYCNTQSPQCGFNWSTNHIETQTNGTSNHAITSTKCNDNTSNQFIQSLDAELLNVSVMMMIDEDHLACGSGVHNLTSCLPNNMQRKIKKKKTQKRQATIQFITEEGSSYPLDLSSRPNTNSKSRRRDHNHSMKGKNRSSVVNMNQTPCQIQAHLSSNSSYRVRFSHNVFEEIAFKNTNPSQKFYKFNGIVGE